tara:strand:+ start:1149 stop:1637 length:489 start_codon:yes stop_codon:yes gene_type:complete
MAKIVLDTFKKQEGPKYKNYFTYGDLALDLKFEQLQNEPAFSSLTTKDVRGSYDLDAIKNSVRNLFTSFPGDKILNPEFGLNLTQFLFRATSKDTANLIGQLIYREIKKQEPRVIAERVSVEAQIDQQQYNITLLLSVPFINNNNTFELKATLNSTGTKFYS